MKFHPEFDVVAVMLSVVSLLILLYFGIAIPSFSQNLWVAYAFWIAGFIGANSLGLVQRSQALTFEKIFGIATFAGIIILAFFGINFAYAHLPQNVMFADKFISFAVGISEELFFGVFVLGLLINYVGLEPILAIFLSAGVHSFYHVPNWGYNPSLLILFFFCFFVARSVYVFAYPKVGVILAAHGVWNFGIGGVAEQIVDKLKFLEAKIWVLLVA